MQRFMTWRSSLVAAAFLAAPALALAAVSAQETSAPAYEVQDPTHELARDCMSRVTRAIDGQVTATVRCTANNRGRLGRCELVEPTAEAQRHRRLFVCLAEAHRLSADDLTALDGEAVEVGLTIG